MRGRLLGARRARRGRDLDSLVLSPLSKESVCGAVDGDRGELGRHPGVEGLAAFPGSPPDSPSRELLASPGPSTRCSAALVGRELSKVDAARDAVLSRICGSIS